MKNFVCTFAQLINFNHPIFNKGNNYNTNENMIFLWLKKTEIFNNQ